LKHLYLVFHIGKYNLRDKYTIISKPREER